MREYFVVELGPKRFGLARKTAGRNHRLLIVATGTEHNMETLREELLPPPEAEVISIASAKPRRKARG